MVRRVPVDRSTARHHAAWILLAVVWAAFFLCVWLGAPDTVERTLKGLLMPALLLCVVVAQGARAPFWLVLGLIFATIGDIAIDVTLEAGLLGFLGMQICYIVGFLRLGAAWAPTARWAALGYGLVWITVNLALGPALGDLRLPVLVYSAALCTMAALGAGVNARIGVGAALFLISDTLIACGEADLDFVGRSALVMPTYLAAQYLIATGWLRRVSPGVRLPL